MLTHHKKNICVEMSIIDDKSKLVTWRNLGSCSHNIAAEASKPNFSATDVIWLKKKTLHFQPMEFSCLGQ